MDDDDYENDEGEYNEDEDEYDSSSKANKIKTKLSRVEIQLPQRIDITSTTEKSNQIDGTESTSIEITTTSSQTKSMKLIRFPEVRSETVPDGFKGKIEEKRQKINFTSAKNKQSNDGTKIDIKPDTYVTVTKSISGSLDNSNSVAATDDKKFESTYYTKSSTCGYFTFSCNIVYGSNGRSKICRPKTPSNGKC